MWIGNGWKWGTICDKVMDWFGFGGRPSAQNDTIDTYGTFMKHDISNTEARLYPKNTVVIEKYVPNLEH